MSPILMRIVFMPYIRGGIQRQIPTHKPQEISWKPIEHHISFAMGT